MSGRCDDDPGGGTFAASRSAGGDAGCDLGIRKRDFARARRLAGTGRVTRFRSRFGDAADEHPAVSHSQSSAAAMGLCPRRDRRRPTPITRRWRKSRLWCRRAFAATCRRGIRRCVTASRSTTAAISGKSQEILEAVWAAAPQGGRERILLRACIQIATANLRLRMQKPHAAARLLGEALGELKALGVRKARRRRRLCRRLSDRRTGGAAARPNWSCRCCPRPIGSHSAPSAEHETKCMFLAF